MIHGLLIVRLWFLGFLFAVLRLLGFQYLCIVQNTVQKSQFNVNTPQLIAQEGP